MVPYLLLIAIVYLVALIPAFGPPVWIVLVVAKFRWDLNPVLLVSLGAITSASGRYTLARASRHLERFVPKRAKLNLEAAHRFLEGHSSGIFALLAVFVVSPLPSGQLFVAAGLLRMRLLTLTAAYFVGRVISYSLYVSAATVAEYSAGDILGKIWGKPWAIALQILLAAAIIAIPFIPWKQTTTEATQESPTL